MVGTTFSILKLIVGAGSFVLPSVCAKVGFLGLGLCLTGLALLAFYCSWLVTSLKQKQAPLENLSMAEFTARQMHPVLGAVCEACVLGASIGGCSVYLNFCGSLLSQVYCHIPSFIYVLSIGGVVLLFIFLQAFLVVYRDWDPLLFLSRSSLVGFAAAIGAAIATLIIGGIDQGIGKAEGYLLINVAEFPNAYGSIAFLFCVALFMFPVHSAIDRPRSFNKALIAGYSVAYFFNLAFSSLVFAIFGSAVKGIIVQNLPFSRASQVTQIVLTLDILFTFLVVVVPSSASVKKLLGKISPKLRVNEEVDEPIRSIGAVFVMVIAPILVLLLCLCLAIFVPQVGSLVDFVSAIGLSFTALILPALLKLYTTKNHIVSWIFHIAIIVFAATAGGYTLYNTFSSIIATYQQQGVSGIFDAACNATSNATNAAF